MSKPDVLIINTYGGSLALAAKAAGVKIRGLYEDAGFGSDIQELNFPRVHQVRTAPWPKDDLTESVVIAHPPCAAFSKQNAGNKAAMGVGTPAFACHRRVMDYAMGNNCMGLAIESVPGALKHGAGEYAAAAKKHGYSYFFVQQNAVSFGVPQWRPRVWMIFLRDREHLSLNIAHRFRSVGQALEGMDLGDKVKENQTGFRRLAKSGLTREQVAKRFLTGEYPGGLVKILRQALKLDSAEVKAKFHLEGCFGSYLPYVLDPGEFAPVVMSDSFWWIAGRPCTRQQYQRIMGFPDDYRWGRHEAKARMYLSKGVCPPVARWVLEELIKNVTLDPYIGKSAVLSPGEVADLQPDRTHARNMLKQGRLRFDA